MEERGQTQIVLAGVPLDLHYKAANLRQCKKFCGYDAMTLMQKIAEQPTLMISLDILLGMIAIGLVTDLRYRHDEADTLLDKLAELVDKEQAKQGGPIVQAIAPHAQKVLRAFSYSVVGKDIFVEAEERAKEEEKQQSPLESASPSSSESPSVA